MVAEAHIGVSGWTYPPWRGDFYPQGLPQHRELAYASTIFNAIELNGSFYSLQTPKSFGHWSEQTPDGFVFAVKGSRFITHMLRLRQPEAALANFFASGLLRLGAKLGPILWQFPASFRFDRALMENFLGKLPCHPDDAAKLARRHDERVKHGAWLEADGITRLRYAVEIRHDSFRDPDFIELLRDHNVALVCADTVEWPRLMDLTANFVYCRLHGSQELYRSAYDEPAIDRWAARARAWRAGQPMHDGEFVVAEAPPAWQREVYIFFDNTDKRHAPHDAKMLMQKLDVAKLLPGG